MSGSGTAELVSVVVPACNAARTVGRTLASALAQTYPRVEVIVVDDGSTDGTAAVLSATASRDPRLRFVRQPNRGVACARNLGVAHARGPLIAPLDADDLWHPRTVEKLAAALAAAGPRAGVAYALSRWIDADDRVRRGPSAPVHQGDVYAALVVRYFLGNASCTLIRRECLEEVGGYDPSLREQGAQGCEDWRLYLAIAERWEFACVPEHLVGYRVAPGRMSGDPERMLRSWRLVMEEARRRHPELPERLFRWSAGEVHRWLAAGAVSDGDLATGLRLAARALVADPSGTLRLKVAAGAPRRLAEALGLVSAGVPGHPPARGAVRPGTPFADARPDAPGGDRPHRWELRRAAEAGTVRVLATVAPPPSPSAPGTASTRAAET